MTTLDEIQRPINREMEEFETHFRDAMRSKHRLLDKITHYIIKRKGKQMRPMFVFLTSKMLGGITPSSFHAATLIELLHTATLVHDDVVDDAFMRRDFFSINALWKNKIAVLVGDYLLSRGLKLSVENNEYRLLQIVSTAVQEMSEGELLQQEKSRLLNITEAVYLEIITQKTASLLAACCRSGAAAAGCSADDEQKMFDFGINVGLAFQIKDDLFDYGMGFDIGKQTGIDIQERKLTLPLIYSLQQTDAATRRSIINKVKNHNTESKAVKEIIDFVTQSGGIDYAVQRMEYFRDKALNILHTFAANEARHALEAMVHYTINRKK